MIDILREEKEREKKEKKKKRNKIRTKSKQYLIFIRTINLLTGIYRFLNI